MRLNRKAVALGICLLILGLGVVILNNTTQFVRSLRSYSDVHLTDAKADVLYRLGYPPWVLGDSEKAPDIGEGYWQPIYNTDAKAEPKNAMPEGKKIQDFDGWSYPLGDQSHGTASTSVTFDHATNKVTSVSCMNTADVPLQSCPPLAGIKFGDTEESVLERYGKPYRFQLDGVTKKIRFDDLGIELALVRGKVYMLTLHSENEDQFAVIKRYLRSLLP
jgi:hypothetical protein